MQSPLGEWIASGPVAAHVAWFAIAGLGAVAVSATLTLPFVLADHYVHIIAETVSIFSGFASFLGPT